MSENRTGKSSTGKATRLLLRKQEISRAQLETAVGGTSSVFPNLTLGLCDSNLSFTVPVTVPPAPQNPPPQEPASLPDNPQFPFPFSAFPTIGGGFQRP